MMETKLWAALCALLLVNLGSADHDGNHANPSPSPKSAPEASSVDSSLNPISQAVTTPPTNGSNTTPTSNVTSSFVNNTSTEEQEAISLTPEPKEANGTNIVSSTEVDNVTHHSTAQPPIPASGSHAPTSHIPVTAVAINATHPAHTAPVDTTQSATPSTNTSSHVESTLPQPTNQTTLPKTHSSTSAPTPEPANTTTTTVAQPDSTSSASSSREPKLNPVSSTLTQTPPKTSHTETSGTTSTTTPPQKVHDNPSPLNVGGNGTTMVHESPKLDPLLAGLVSAFIITAVIITLLLFLKLRRRDNRPFHRLQDLPMDDMEEDTPLSMYSY